MLKYKIYAERNFRKQYKRMKIRGLDMSLLDEVIFMLANDITLPAKYHDHPLRGDKRGYRDCHVQNDWVLLYKIDKGVLTLILSATGTHSDILE